MNLRSIFSIFLIVIVACFHLAAQETEINQVENDYQQFKEIFEQEFNNSDSSFFQNRIAIHPASLANWLSHIPESDKNSVYAIGISDPGMQRDEAVQLAILRAKIILALLLEPKISSITDSYINEESKSKSGRFTTKYANYYYLFASLSAAPQQFEVTDQFITSFDEAIVLLKYDLSAPRSEIVDSVMLKIEIYQAERQQKNKFEFEEKCKVYGLSKQNNSQEGIDIFYYFYRSVNQFYEIVSRFNGRELNYPQSVFRYQALSSIKMNKAVEEVSYKLTHGLWKAFLQSFIQSYTLAIPNPDVDIAQVGDHYSSSSQNLSRELVITAPNFKLNGIRINNNRLSVILTRDE